MQTINNKSFEIKGIKSSYAEMMIQCLNQMPKEGFSPDEMKKRIRIIEIIENNMNAGSYMFEDADFEKLGQCANQMRWTFISREILSFLDCFKKKD